MKEILFVETLLDYQTSLAYLKKNPSAASETVVVNLNTYNVLDYSNTRVTVKTENDYVLKDTLQGINEKAEEAGRSWCVDGQIAPLLQCEGLNLGLILESFLVRQLIVVYKYVRLAKVILKQEQCANFLLIDHPRGFPKVDTLLPSNSEKILNDVMDVLQSQHPVQLRSIPSQDASNKPDGSDTPWAKDLVKPFANLLRIVGNGMLRKRDRRRGDEKVVVLVGAPRLIFPMIDEFRHNSDLRIVYFQGEFGPRMVFKLWSKKTRYKISEDYRTSDEEAKRAQFRQGLSASLRRLILCERFRALIQYDGMDVMPVLIPRLKYAFEECLPNVLIEVQRFKKFFSEEKVGVIVIDEALRGQFSRPLIMTAHACGIGSVELQHGIPDDYSSLRMVTGKLAVWGEYCRRRYATESGLNIQDVIVTGSPTMDALRHRAWEKDEAFVRHFLKVDPSHRIITLALPPFHRSSRGGIVDEHFTREQLEYTVREILVALNPLNKIHLVIKMHPTEPNARHAEKFIRETGFQRPISLVHAINIHPLIRSSSVLLSLGSTTILEAMVMETPVVLINFLGKQDPNPYAEWSALSLVKEPKELQDAVEAILLETATDMAATAGTPRPELEC